jgi:3' terminal RNA ribose 2'-O-methyltransferase Hen1
MQIEITLDAPDGTDYDARDLGFLLHKNPDRVHERTASAGPVTIFFAEATRARATAVLHLDVDPVGLVRGRGEHADGLLDSYVNNRPYVANSFLSVALARSFATTRSGRSREKQALLDRKLPLSARIVPVAIAGGAGIARELFGPLGYEVTVDPVGEPTTGTVFDLRIAGKVLLTDLLTHLYVLVPVMDNAKHYWIDRSELESLLAKGRGWLETHPAKALITRRALSHRGELVNLALARLAEMATPVEPEDDESASPGALQEAALEVPISLHTQRLDAVAAVLKQHGARTILDLGCGEGKLIARLLKERHIERVVGVDASVRTLETAARRLRLDRAGEAKRARIALLMGSLTYADRRWQGFDAAALVEVIEHIEPPRLSAVELSLFAEARPGLVVITTPNREYNQLFPGMAPNAMRHADHRFEWSRAEFAAWCNGIAARHGYAFTLAPIGPEDAVHGAPSQMAVFTRGGVPTT